MKKLGWTSIERQIAGALAAAAALCALAVGLSPDAALGLTPFSRGKGCVSAQPASPCKKGDGTGGGPIVLSPDGRFAYVASYVSSTLTVFALHGGRVSQVQGPGGCIAGGEGRAGCARDQVLDEPDEIVLSPDGRQAYVANAEGNEVDVFDRDAATGRLRPAPGIPAVEVEEPNALVSSPDGRELYVADGLGKVAVLDRDPETGAVHLAEEVEDCVPGPHGCLAFLGFKIVVSADGGSVYLASVPRDSHSPSVEAVQGFDRSPVTGSLMPIAGPGGCATNIEAGSCQTVPRLGVSSLAISPDGKNLYAGAISPGAIFTFDREPSGAIVAKRGNPVCLGGRDHGTCSALSPADAEGLVVSADGREVYATGQGLTPPQGSRGSLVTLGRDPEGALHVVSRLKHPSFTLGLSLALSSNGRILYDSVGQPGGLRSFAVRSGQARAGCCASRTASR